jgi:hypothetical protein
VAADKMLRTKPSHFSKEKPGTRQGNLQSRDTPDPELPMSVLILLGMWFASIFIFVAVFHYGSVLHLEFQFGVT